MPPTSSTTSDYVTTRTRTKHPSFEVLFPLGSFLSTDSRGLVLSYLSLLYFTHFSQPMLLFLTPTIPFLFSRRSFVPGLRSVFSRARSVASRQRCQPLQTHSPQDHVAGFHSVNPRLPLGDGYGCHGDEPLA